MTTIAGKTIVITGASRGLGASLAHALAQADQVTIVGIARSSQELAVVGAEVTAAGGDWVGIPFDISQLERLPLLVETIQASVSQVDILINNAGIEIYSAFQDYSLADLQAVINTNLIAAMELSRLLLPEMLRRSSGHIVNMSSLAAKKGHPYDSIYSASKAGLQMWSDALRQELWKTGVEVSIICPGYVCDQGLLTNTGIPAPKLAGSSTSERVVQAIVQAIMHNRAEIWVNQNWLWEIVTMVLFAFSAILPRITDFIYRYVIGIPQGSLLRSRVPRSPKTTTIVSEVRPLVSSTDRS
jgi:short-subunit dehydrogenase